MFKEEEEEKYTSVSLAYTPHFSYQNQRVSLQILGELNWPTIRTSSHQILKGVVIH